MTFDIVLQDLALSLLLVPVAHAVWWLAGSKRLKWPWSPSTREGGE